MNWSAPELVTPPAVEPVPIGMLRDWCRVGGNDDDAKLIGLGIAARQHIEAAPGGLRLMTQTVRLRADRFEDEMRLPVHPLQSATIAYLDTDGVLQTLSPAVYEVSSYGLAPCIRLAPGMSWPATAASHQAVQISAVVGWADINALPEPIRLAIQILVCHWFDNPTAGAPPSAVAALLTAHRQPVGF